MIMWRVLFSLCVSSWQEVFPETSTVAGTTTKVVLSTEIQGKMFNTIATSGEG